MITEYLIPENFLEEIEKFLTNNKERISFKRFQKYASPEFKQWLEERNIPSRFLSYIHKNHLTKIIIPTCPTCGKELLFKQIFAGSRFCSNKCKGNNKETQAKRKQTCLEKYGVLNVSQSDSIKNKKKASCLEHYGVENPHQSKAIQEKTQQTNLERYGVEHPAQAKAIKEKTAQTNLEKYGVKCSLQSKKVREKGKQTFLEKYGVEHALQLALFQEKYKQTCLEKYGVDSFSKTEEYKEKVKQTCLEHYGVENPIQSKEIREKIKQTCLEKYGTETFTESKEWKERHRLEYWETFCSQLKEKNIVPLFSKEEYINDTGRRFKCLNCGEEFVSEGVCNYKKEHKKQDGTYSTLLTNDIHCPHCTKLRYSKKEKEVVDFVHSIYNGEILENHKGLFPNKNMELDIYLPQLNLGIEFDGDYWHSKEGAKEKDERKNQLCEEKGIKLLRIKESDWDTNRTQVENQIKEFLGINQ